MDYTAQIMAKPRGVTLRARSPDLVQQWHPTRNGAITPDDVGPGTHIKVWWLCSKGHEWEAAIYSRVAGSGCPYCGQRRVGYGNDFATHHPALAKEWHPSKNGDQTPDMFLPRSNQKVWWLGACGHEWQSVLANRTGPIRAGCPYCANQKVGNGNDLTSRFPEIAAEWHPTKNGDMRPEEVTSGASHRVWWQCKEGHEWRAPVFKRTTQGYGCERCGLIGLSLLDIEVYAELEHVLVRHMQPCVFDHRVAAADGRGLLLRIDMVFGDIAVEFDGWHWHRNKVRKDREKSERLGEVGYTAIRVREHPLSPLGPLDVSVRRAPKALEVALAVLQQLVDRDLLTSESAADAKAYIGSGTLRAEGKAQRIIRNLRDGEYGDRSLSAIHPGVAAEWHPTLNGNLTPRGVTPSSGRRVWWLCPQGHDYQAPIGQRTGSGTGCGKCSGRYVTPETSLAAKKPALAAQWHPTLNEQLTPELVTPHSRQVVWWLCPHGHSTQDTVDSRTKGYVCQECPNSRRDKNRKPTAHLEGLLPPLE